MAMVLLCASCLFTGSDIEKYEITNNYYITCLSDTLHISFREEKALTEKIVITENRQYWLGWQDNNS